MIDSPLFIALTISIGFLAVSALAYLCVIAAEYYKEHPKLDKICAVLLAIGFIVSGALMGFSYLAVSYGDKDVVLESEIIDSIDLPNASVEMVFTNDDISGIKIIQSLNNLVGIKQYTNVECQNPTEATLLQIAKQKCALVFNHKIIFKYDKEVAILT